MLRCAEGQDRLAAIEGLGGPRGGEPRYGNGMPRNCIRMQKGAQKTHMVRKGTEEFVPINGSIIAHWSRMSRITCKVLDAEGWQESIRIGTGTYASCNFSTTQQGSEISEPCTTRRISLHPEEDDRTRAFS